MLKWQRRVDELSRAEVSDLTFLLAVAQEANEFGVTVIDPRPCYRWHDEHGRFKNPDDVSQPFGAAFAARHAFVYVDDIEPMIERLHAAREIYYSMASGKHIAIIALGRTDEEIAEALRTVYIADIGDEFIRRGVASWRQGVPHPVANRYLRHSADGPREATPNYLQIGENDELVIPMSRLQSLGDFWLQTMPEPKEEVTIDSRIFVKDWRREECGFGVDLAEAPDYTVIALRRRVDETGYETVFVAENTTFIDDYTQMLMERWEQIREHFLANILPGLQSPPHPFIDLLEKPADELNAEERNRLQMASRYVRRQQERRGHQTLRESLDGGRVGGGKTAMMEGLVEEFRRRGIDPYRPLRAADLTTKRSKGLADGDSTDGEGPQDPGD